jgi:hypothetical protein
MANNSNEENRIKSAMTGSVTGFAAKTALVKENVAPSPVDTSRNSQQSEVIIPKKSIGGDWNDTYEIDESKKIGLSQKIVSYLNNIFTKPTKKIDEAKEKSLEGPLKQTQLTKTGLPKNAPTNVQTTITQKSKTLGIKTNKSKNLFKSCFVTLIILFVCILVTLILAYLNLDTKVVKLTLSGTITDERTSEPIAEVQLIVDDKVIGTSDENGVFEIKNLDVDNIEVKFKVENYYEKIENISLKHSLLDYNVKKDITLRSSLISSLRGVFLTDQKDHKFAEDKLEVEDQTVSLNADGSFVVQDIPVGKVMLKYSSPMYENVSKVLNLEPGENTLDKVDLVPAGDIVGDVISYLLEDVVLTTKFLIENVQDDQITVENSGKFTISDLEVDRTYKIRVTAEGYETRDYSIKIQQGLNKLFDFKLVEVGNSIFTKTVNSSNSKETQLFASNFDGMNLTQLTDIEDFAPKYIYYDEASKLAYFSSDHANNRGVLRNYIFLPYVINLETREITKIFTAPLTDVGNLYPNFQAQKVVNITSLSANSKQRILKVSNLDGTSSKQLRTISAGEFGQITISDNGEYVFFYEKDISKNQNSFYRINIATSKVDESLEIEEFSLFDVSSNGNRIIFSARKDSSNFLDLFMADYSTGEIRTLMRNYDGKNYQFKSGSDDVLLFYANREGIDNIYSYSISKNKDSRITNLTSDVKISELYQQGKFIFYKSNKGLFVLDFDKPKSGKKVVSLE